MDKIILKNLGFFAFHGVLAEEKTLGQKFFIDLELSLDLRTAGASDDVSDTVNYGEVYELVKEQVTKKSFNLLEALAENIASCILSKFLQIQEVTVTIRKPEAPVEAIFDYFAVEIRRMRNG